MLPRDSVRAVQEKCGVAEPKEEHSRLTQRVLILIEGVRDRLNSGDRDLAR